MTYKEAMKTNDMPEWDQPVKEEHERMVAMNIWKSVPKGEVPKEAKVITTTWAMKKNKCKRFYADEWRALQIRQYLITCY